jgi:hypothetical protein
MPRDPDNRFDAEPSRESRVVVLRTPLQRIAFAAVLIGCALAILAAAVYFHHAT